MEINRVIVASMRSASGCGVKRTVVEAIAVAAICPGLMARHATTIVSGVRRVNVYRVRVNHCKWCKAVGAHGVHLHLAVLLAVVAYKNHSANAIILCRRMVGNIVRVVVRNIAPAIRTHVRRVHWIHANSNVTKWMVETSPVRVLHARQNGYRSMAVSSMKIWRC